MDGVELGNSAEYLISGTFRLKFQSKACRLILHFFKSLAQEKYSFSISFKELLSNTARKAAMPS